MMTPVTARSRVIYLEDDALAIRALARAMARGPLELHAASTLAEARAMFLASEWCGVIADFHLPDGTGLAFVREARSLRPRLPAIVATGDPHVQNEVIEAGILCLQKPFLPSHLAPFVRAVAAFERSAYGPRVTTLARAHGLGVRELDVLCESLATRGLAKIARRLGIAVTTLRTHRAHVLRKVGASDFPSLRARLFPEGDPDDEG